MKSLINKSESFAASNVANGKTLKEHIYKMDVLKPEIVLVDGRCYRFFDSTAWSQNRELGSYEEETFQPTYDSDEDICDSNIEIVPHTGGRYKHSFHAPKYSANNLFLKNHKNI